MLYLPGLAQREKEVKSTLKMLCLVLVLGQGIAVLMMLGVDDNLIPQKTAEVCSFVFKLLYFGFGSWFSFW